MDIESLAKGKGKSIGVRGLNRNNVNDPRISINSLSEQQKIVSQIETIEKQIAALEAEIAVIPQQKEQVLRKGL